MFPKKLFYASASLFLLAAAYHLGASTATAQAPSNPVVAGYRSVNVDVVVTANGDVYATSDGIWRLVQNVFIGGPPVPATPSTFGALKAKYR
jgi:hypothetical protein